MHRPSAVCRGVTVPALHGRGREAGGGRSDGRKRKRSRCDERTRSSGEDRDDQKGRVDIFVADTKSNETRHVAHFAAQPSCKAPATHHSPLLSSPPRLTTPLALGAAYNSPSPASRHYAAAFGRVTSTYLFPGGYTATALSFVQSRAPAAHRHASEVSPNPSGLLV